MLLISQTDMHPRGPFEERNKDCSRATKLASEKVQIVQIVGKTT